MAKKLEMEIKVGLFVTTGVAALCLAVLVLGGSGSAFSRHNVYSAHFSAADGLFQGAKVVLGGLNVGAVSRVDLDRESKDIVIDLTVEKKYEQFIREGSEAEILTQGVLGDKYISVSIGPADNKILANGAELPNRPTKNFSEVLSRGDALMNSLNSISTSLDSLMKSLDVENSRTGLFKNLGTTARNLSDASIKLSHELDGLELAKLSHSLHAILEKVNNGTGTLGALVNDPGLYDDAKALMGGANRNRIIRNLVRKTIEDSQTTEPPKK